MKNSLPASVVPSCINPPIWDRVIETNRVVAAVAWTASGVKKARQLGWDHAVEGKEPQYNMPAYQEGYNLGLFDIAKEKAEELDKEEARLLSQLCK